MKNQALGLIETYGYVTAIEAADASLKAANVTLKKCEFVKGGLVTILLVGDVSTVKASIDAGEAAANRVGKVVSKTVIARTGEGISEVFYDDEKGKYKQDYQLNKEVQLKEKVEDKNIENINNINKEEAKNEIEEENLVKKKQ